MYHVFVHLSLSLRKGEREGGIHKKEEKKATLLTHKETSNLKCISNFIFVHIPNYETKTMQLKLG